MQNDLVQDLRYALQALRGGNAFRGRVVWLASPVRVLIAREARGTRMEGRPLCIRVGDTPGTVSVQLADGLRTLADFADAQAFLQAVLDEARGKKAYIRTQDNVATYK